MRTTSRLLAKSLVTAALVGSSLCLLGGFATGCSLADGDGIIGGPADKATSDDSGSTPAPSDAGSTPGDDAARTPSDDSGATPEASPDASPPPPPAPEYVAVKGLSIKELAIFQGVKAPLAKDGVHLDVTEKVHVVAGREGILRVYVTPAADWTSREVIAELTLKVAGQEPKVVTATKTVTVASTDDKLDSTINIPLATGLVEVGATYKIRLLTKPGQTTGEVKAASFPEGPEGDAFDTMDVYDTGESLKVVLVPVKSNGYTPDISEAQIERYRAELYAMYPAKKIDLTVRAVWSYSGTLGVNGNGIYGLLDAITALRKSDGAAKDVYYYGAFTPTSSWSTYCVGSCTTGLCHLAGATDTSLRACVGAGYTGKGAAGTLAHELGHAHARRHAPCGGVAGADSTYPYSGGLIGAWGYDLRTKTLVTPSTSKDFMSYCGPEWISDYTYDKLIHRMSTVATQPLIIGAESQTYRMVRVTADGTLEWGSEIETDDLLTGEQHDVTYTLADGSTANVRGYFYPYSDADGGTLMVPKARVRPTMIDVRGFSIDLHAAVPSTVE